jgi:chromosome segregation ATPase
MNDRTDALRHEIMQLEIETAQLVQQYNKGMVQKGEMEKQEHTLAKKVKEGQKELQILQEEVDKQKKALAEEQQIQNKSQETEAYLKALQDEITRLEDNKAQLDGDIKRLGQLQSRPGLGQLPQNLK